jgi:hypothetical protein
VRACLDDLVIALYVTIDELLGPDPRRGRPGRKPRLSDAELVCLAVAQVLLGCHDEHRWLRFCYGRLGHLFPICPTSPATTSDCAKPAGCWTRSWPTWPARPRRPRHPQAAGRHPGPLRRLADHAPALGAARHRRLRLVSQPLALVLGLKLYVLTTPTAARSPGAWPAPSWASARSPWRCWTEAASSPAKSSSSTRAWPAPRSTGTWPTGGGPGPPRPPR